MRKYGILFDEEIFLLFFIPSHIENKLERIGMKKNQDFIFRTKPVP